MLLPDLTILPVSFLGWLAFAAGGLLLVPLPVFIGLTLWQWPHREDLSIWLFLLVATLAMAAAGLWLTGVLA
jgi:hypothetical protein